jgi:hypothetical protein
MSTAMTELRDYQIAAVDEIEFAIAAPFRCDNCQASNNRPAASKARIAALRAADPPEVLSWVRSRFIAYAKAKAKSAA